MPKKPYVALLLFSNDLQQYLHQVERERKLLEEALEHYHDTNRLQVIARSAVSAEEIFRLFNRYRGRIVLFHFAGHAEGHGLQLNQHFTDVEMGKAVGLADLFRREVTDGSLQLVFLNGCSTEPQVAGLQDAGVPSIIATRYPIQDQKALRFAEQFYRSLANTGHPQPFDTPTSIQQAFDDALAYLKTKFDLKTEKTTRGIKVGMPGAGLEEPWYLYTAHPEWSLSSEPAEESRTFNERLTQELIHAVEPHYKYARSFLEAVASEPDWAANPSWTGQAKLIINAGFVGVLGIQLRKLFAIGQEASSETKQRKYLLNCLLTTRRALQLLCFSLLSKFWDLQRERSIDLNPDRRAQLQHFFDGHVEPDIQEYMELLNNLLAIFSEHQLAFPIEELPALAPQLAPGGTLRSACDRLHELHLRLNKSQFKLADCFTAERQLSTVLSTLGFLAAYQMVSIKNVAYDAMRNSPPHYLQHYIALGLDRKQNVNREKIKYDAEPTNTDAIILFKAGRPQRINLFPFVIDLNALTFESGSKIYFYSFKDLNKVSLNYTFLEDNSLVNVKHKNTVTPDAKLNLIMMDIEKRKDRKLDFVFEQFQAARQAILQTTEVVKPILEEEDDEDDF